MVTVNIDTSEIQDKLTELRAKMDGLPGEIAKFCDSDIVPTLQGKAADERNVITGNYAGDWETEVTSDGAQITTDAFYWVYLEGGTSKVQPKPVVHESVDENITDLSQDLKDYLSE